MSGLANTALLFLAGWAAVRLILPGTLSLIRGSGFIRPNYQGIKIPCGAGVVISIGGLAVLTAAFFFLPAESRQKCVLFLFLLSGYTLLGLIDDIWGNGECRGLSGHVKALLQGRLTTGSIKALAGGLLALLASAASEPLSHVLSNTLVIALSVNMVNLLDLRPGRAGKCFLALFFLILAVFPFRVETVFLAVVAGGVLAYLPADLKSEAMMGDAGSNALGAVLGISAVWLFGPETGALYLAVLIMAHLLAEKYSLSRIISSSRVLNYLDRLWRE